MNDFYEFEDFRVDAEKRLLWKDGDSVSIKPKTFETLLALLKSKNEISTKDDLIKQIWNGDAVSDDSLTQQISQLRKVLGDPADNYNFIVTVSGIGYKFVADVRQIQSANGNGNRSVSLDLTETEKAETSKGEKTDNNFFGLEKQNELEEKPEKNRNNQQKSDYFTAGNKKILLFAFTAFLAIGLTAVFIWQNYKTVEPTTALGVKRIAVLPFRAEAENDETQALKNGMTDSLVTRLSRIEKLIVLPSALTAGYENSGKNSLDFGKQIGADAVLDGMIRKNDGQIIVNIQLIRISDGKVVWAESFQNEFTDILEVQRLIAYKIAEALSLELSDEETRALMKRYTTSAEAYRLFLDATYIQNGRKGKEARVLAELNYEKAIRLDPNFALAYVYLANLQLHSPSPKAYLKMKILSEQALDIDPDLGDAYGTLGFAVWRGDWNWKDSEKYLKKAVELSPNDIGAYGTYSMILAGQGKFEEALNVIRSEKSDSEITLGYQAAIHFLNHDFDKTIEICLEKLKTNPKSITALSYLAPAYSEKGMHDEAIKTAEKYAALDETADAGSFVYLGYAYIKAGQIEKGKEILQRMSDKNAPDSAQIHGALAMLYGAFGEKDKAFEHLEKSIENREWWAFTLKVAPYYDSLRNDSRYLEMLEMVNLAN